MDWFVVMRTTVGLTALCVHRVSSLFLSKLIIHNNVSVVCTFVCSGDLVICVNDFVKLFGRVGAMVRSAGA